MYQDSDDHRIWNFEELPSEHFKRKYFGLGLILGGGFGFLFGLWV